MFIQTIGKGCFWFRGFANKAKELSKQFDDLNAQLRAKFGSKVDNPNWQQLFNGLVDVSVAIDRLPE